MEQPPPLPYKRRSAQPDCSPGGSGLSTRSPEPESPAPLDALDRRLLAALQRDSGESLDALARRVGASKTPVWNRVRRLRETGVIRREAAVLDPDKLGLGACFFVLVRTNRHEQAWLDDFTAAVRESPEIVGAHRLAGDIDYILQVRVSDARAYDRFYRRLIARVSIHEVTALLSMEDLKPDAPLPVAPG
jgi:Lrp/AsnC family transcriptional regulator